MKTITRRSKSDSDSDSGLEVSEVSP
jgi:hypothetical protein